jgi:Rad3-related DNA helicase
MPDITIEQWREFFPFDKIRKEQELAIDFALNAFINQGKRYVIAEVGTGGGKSAIGVTVARYLDAHAGPATDNEGRSTSGTYVLTTQKILQQQYLNDFGIASGRNLIRSLRSASNYQCRFYGDQTCAESRRLLKQLGTQLAGSDFHRCCRGSCPYSIDKQEFIDHALGITNFSYFLAETMYAKQLEPRKLLIIDECHNVENELGKFIEVTFSERFARTILGCKPPKLDTAEAVVAWIKGPYKKALGKHMLDIERKLSAHFNVEGSSTGLADISKRYEMLDKHCCKVNRFIATYDPQNWVMNPVKTPANEQRGGRKFEFKPVDVAPFGFDHLYKFGSYVLLMSATVVDKDTYCRSIGLDAAAVAYLRIPSPFPVENRPVHFLGCGSMSKNCIDETLPKLVETVRALLDGHKDEKGIIHCVNYRIAQHLVDAIRSRRLVIHNSDNREEMIQFHIDSPEPTVLISPSMMEGVDLADAASRFQVLCKVPFPYLGDKVVQLRKDRDPSWYACQTARSVIQALGRSIRNDTDHAVSYILDSDWVRFYRNHVAMFPEEFSAALT